MFIRAAGATVLISNTSCNAPENRLNKLTMCAKLGGIAPECIRLENVFVLDRQNLIIRLVLLALVTLSTPKVRAEFTITNCDEASIREALANGPIIKFSCDGTITLTNNLT